jgi:Uma2 family endonuclease
VDNELQDLIPTLLKLILGYLWKDRMDWFFGVDMGVYYDPDLPAVVPDGFLSLGVDRIIDEDLRLSYVFWEERVVPILALEVVSQKYRGEYSTKKELYRRLGIRYYVIYSTRRRRKPRLEIYRLVNDAYVLQPGNPVWMPEIELGLGTDRGLHQGVTREWLYWYNERGDRYPTPDERAEQADERAEQADERAEQADERAEQAEQQLQDLISQLRARGIDPDQL